MPRIDNISNFGDFTIPSGSFIGPNITASIGKLTASFIDSDTLLVGTIKPPPGQSGVIMEGFNPCCVYVTGSNSAEAIRTSSIQPKLTSHDNQGQCSVINGGNSHSIDANTQYGGIQSGYSSSLVQQCGSNIAGGLENIILPGSKGRVKANTIIGGGNNKLVGTEYSSILGGINNCITNHTSSFIVGSNITATASCTAYVNCLNIQDIDTANPQDQLLVRHTASGLVRQGPTITEVSGSNFFSNNLFNPNVDVYTTGSNSNPAIATSSIEPYYTPGNINYGACSVINGGDNNIIGGSPSATLTGSVVGGGFNNRIYDSLASIVGGKNNTIATGSDQSAILGGVSNNIYGHTSSFIIGSNIFSRASCTTHVNCLNIQNIDEAGPSDRLLVRVTGSTQQGLVKQGPTISSISGSGDGLVIEVPGLVNPDRDVYVIADNSDSIIATSSIKPFYMPFNVNEGENSVISSGYSNRLIQMCSVPPQNSGIFSGQYNAISGSNRSTIEGGNFNDIIMGHHLSASVNYTNYAIDHSIQNGQSNDIINVLPSVVRHVSSTGMYQSGSLFYITEYFNNQYNQEGTGSIVWFEHSTYAGSPANSGPQTSGSQAILTPPIVINNYRNAIQNGNNNRILNYAYLNVIDGGNGHLIQSQFFPQRYGIGNPQCFGKTLYFKAAHRNFIGAGAINTIQGASYSGIVAGLRNVIEFDEPGKDNEAKSFIGAGACNIIGMTKMSAIVTGFRNRIRRPGGFNFIGGGRSNVIADSQEAFIGSGCCNLASNYSAVAGGRFNRATGDGTFIGGGVNNCNNNHNGVIVGGFCNTISNGYTIRTENVVVGGRCNRIHANCQSSILGGFNNFIKTNNSNHSSIVGGINNTVSGSSNSSVLGGRNNTITNLNNTFVIGSDLTAERECTSFVNSFDISGSLDMNLFEVPTSSVGLRTGQVYRTGSAFDELRIKL